MDVTLGVAKQFPQVTTETLGPVSPMWLERVNDIETREFGAICRIYTQTPVATRSAAAC